MQKLSRTDGRARDPLGVLEIARKRYLLQRRRRQVRAVRLPVVAVAEENDVVPLVVERVAVPVVPLAERVAAYLARLLGEEPASLVVSCADRQAPPLGARGDRTLLHLCVAVSPRERLHLFGFGARREGAEPLPNLAAALVDPGVHPNGEAAAPLDDHESPRATGG